MKKTLIALSVILASASAFADDSVKPSTDTTPAVIASTPSTTAVTTQKDVKPVATTASSTSTDTTKPADGTTPSVTK